MGQSQPVLHQWHPVKLISTAWQTRRQAEVVIQVRTVYRERIGASVAASKLFPDAYGDAGKVADTAVNAGQCGELFRRNIGSSSRLFSTEL